MSFEMFRAKTLFSLEHKVSKPMPKRESPFALFSLSMPIELDLEEMEEILYGDAHTDHGVPIEAILRATQGLN